MSADSEPSPAALCGCNSGTAGLLGHRAAAPIAAMKAMNASLTASGSAVTRRPGDAFGNAAHVVHPTYHLGMTGPRRNFLPGNRLYGQA